MSPKPKSNSRDLKHIFKRVEIFIGIVILITALVGTFIYLKTTKSISEIQKLTVDQSLIPEGIDGIFAFENVNVIPMSRDDILENKTVIIQNGVIISIETSSKARIPLNASRINGKGKYLMPGLSDMHAHLLGSENDLLLYIVNGVTTIRDMGGTGRGARDEIKAGKRIGNMARLYLPNTSRFIKYFLNKFIF